MTVYVDKFPVGWGKWSGGGHMLATDLDELHEMAKRIGLRREWFQDKRLPHYDVQARKRELAIAAGAVEIELGEIPSDVMMRVGDDEYERRDVLLARREEARRSAAADASRSVSPEMAERGRVAGAAWFAEHPEGLSSDDEWRDHYRAVIEAALGTTDA